MVITASDLRRAERHLSGVDQDWAGLVRQVGLPVDDFGVRDGCRRLKGLEALPTPREIAALGSAWAPWRSVASWYLWRLPRSAPAAGQASG